MTAFGRSSGQKGYGDPSPVSPTSLQSAAVAGQRVKLLVQDRAVLGSAESRRLRKQGLIPGVLYGREQPHAISIAERDLRNALTGAGGMNAVLDVVIDGGQAHSSVLKEYQLHKIRGTITHVDLQEVRLDQPIHATVSIHLRRRGDRHEGGRRAVAGRSARSPSRRCRWRSRRTSSSTCPGLP